MKERRPVKILTFLFLSLSLVVYIRKRNVKEVNISSSIFTRNVKEVEIFFFHLHAVETLCIYCEHFVCTFPQPRLWLEESGKIKILIHVPKRKATSSPRLVLGRQSLPTPAPPLYRVIIRTSNKDVKSLDRSFEPKSHVLGLCSNAAFKVDFSLNRGLQFEVPWIPARQTWSRIYGLYTT